MPFSLRLDPAGEIFVGTGSGDVSLDDAKRSVSSMWAHPDWTGNAVVWDLRSARIELPLSDIHDLARFVLTEQPAIPPPRVAFVTAREVDFGQARMFATFRDHPSTQVRVFRDYDEAIAWARARGDGA